VKPEQCAGWPQICDLSASVPQVLGLQVYVTIHGSYFSYFF
jgi:hypothetical protein